MTKEYEPDTISNAIMKSLEAPALDPILLSVANDSLAGEAVPDMAEKYNVTPDLITQILDNKDVKSYIDNVLLNQGYLNRAKRLGLINRVIEAKLAEALETDVFSKKDLLDWLKHLHEVEQGIKPKAGGPAVAVQVNNNYQKLMGEIYKDEDR